MTEMAAVCANALHFFLDLCYMAVFGLGKLFSFVITIHALFCIRVQLQSLLTTHLLEWLNSRLPRTNADTDMEGMHSHSLMVGM